MNAKLTVAGTEYPVILETNEYRNGTFALMAFDATDGESFCTLSVNIEGASESLPAGAFYGKHWSENDGFLDQLVEQGILVPVDAPCVSSGFVTGIRAYRLANKS